jgi:uncharacterized membrane protein
MRPGVVIRRVGALAIPILLLLALAAPAAAQVGITMTTPYPAVAVQPGSSVSFEVTVAATARANVSLALQGVPDGWTAALTGGGNEVRSVFVEPAAPAVVTLDVEVAPDAPDGTATITLVGSAGTDTGRLALELTVAQEAGGTVSLEPDYPSLRGQADLEFQFNLTLSNDTPQEVTFGLAAQGPAGWEVSVQPSGQTRAASVSVDPRGTQRIDVRTTPPAGTPTGTYPITVTVSGGRFQASTELSIEVTGSVELELTTPDQRLNTTANAGASTDFGVVVINTGGSPLTAVELSGQGPTDWDITFEPASIEQVATGESANATARIVPSGNAVAGDYVVTLSAISGTASESIEVRVTVETAPIWGLLGIGLILVTLGGMAWIFRRYGRR